MESQTSPRALTRRSFLAAAAALSATAGRARAQPGHGFGQAVDAARGFDQLHAMVIALDGDTVVAEAFRGPPVDVPVNVKSVSKTIVAALTGAALDRGEISGVDATLGVLIPDLIPASADARVAEITVADLVTMQAGLERTSGPNYGAWISSADWVGYALGRPLVAEPGRRMLYSTGSFHVLGAVLARVADASLLELARARLGEPLGFNVPPWTRDPQGFYLGGNEMALAPLDMVRFGEMYRREGRWNDAQVLSRDWVAASMVARTRSPFSGLDYGYGWFLGRLGGQRAAIARGYGGQLICVVPGRGLTVAITSDPTLPARSEGYFGDLTRLLGESIIPAAPA